MKNVSANQQNNWRNDVVSWFSDKGIDNVKCFVPRNYFNYEENLHKTERQVQEYYLNRVEKSDLVVVNLEYSASSVGTGKELERAVCRNVPIVGYMPTDTEVYPWCHDDCTVVFRDLDEMCSYIQKYYVDVDR